MIRKTPNLQHLLLAFLFIGIDARAAVSPNRQFHIDYTVAVSNPETNLFHVTAKVENIHQARLEFSLPTWTLGWKTVDNHAKNMLRFKITDANGMLMPHRLTRKQTWSVDTKGHRQIKIEFDYRADTLMVNQAKITKEFAFFTGIQLFLMAEGHRTSPSSVHFVIPAGWKIMSALKETSDPQTFTAPNYDTLVDAPTEMGHFDVTRFEVEGKPHYFVATPAGAFSSNKTEKFVGMLAKVATVQSAIFGGLPYDRYVYFYFFWPPGTTRQSLLEHSNSHVVFAPPGESADLGRMIGLAAHEFFHLWNVMRIRAIEMWPYDYARYAETPLLWVAEGFSNYYSDVATYRAGLISRKQFLERAGEAIRDVETNEARAYISPAESSVRTGIEEGTSVAFGIDYYVQGQNLGGLLDLSIRHDTQGKASLDDVMRRLYRDFYQRGKGFSMEDMTRIINRLTRRDYHDFYRRYVWGVEVPPYDTIYGYAGYRVEKTVRKLPITGFGVERTGRVNIVEPGSPAADAGLLVGDVITKMDGHSPPWPRSIPNTIVKVTIKRAGEEQEILLKVDSRETEDYSIVELSDPTAEQLKIRDGWLRVSN